MNKEQLDKLSPADRKREIAKDVIHQIHSGKFVAASTYLTVSKKHLPLKEILDDGMVCHVCAIGAAFSSLCLMDETRSVRELRGIDHIKNNRMLNKYFNFWELNQMERAFELRSMPQHVYIHYYRMSKSNRLINIMQNIIKNGEFILDKPYTDKCPMQ